MKKNNELGLTTIKSKLRKKEEIKLSKNTFMPINEIIVIKNSGKEQKFNFVKIENMAIWACDNNKDLAKILLEETSIKLYNRIKSIEIQDQLIKTAENLISRIQPVWEKVAAKLYLVKLFKETYNVGGYPHLNEFIQKGLNHRILNKDIFNSYTEEEINELNNYLKTKRDYLFTYKGIKSFAKKYLLSTPKTKKAIELPQLTYMRVAMALHFKKEHKSKIENVKKTYDLISSHLITLATPIMLNAGTNNSQLASCVLNKVEDDTVSIMDVNKDLAIYSKWKGGTSLDIDALRSSDSVIAGNDGKSSGPVPFIKITETIMKAWNQGGKRPGSCAIYFSFWHYNFEELIVLKNNGGIEENRARGLKYAVKINNLFIKRWMKNEEITLFNPSETPKLLETYGEEFEKEYIKYEQTPGIMKKKISSREMWQQIIKERSETGNIYLFHTDNVNEQNMLNKMVSQSNLCTEIVEYTKASTLKSVDISYDKNFKPLVTKQYELGEIALCNLLSFNLYDLYNGSKTDKEIELIIRDSMETMDSTFDVQFYPVPEAEYSNNNWRYIGMGVLNYAKLLAHSDIKFDSQEALEFTHELFDDLSYKILKISMEMAKVKGKFPKFEETLWAKGELPVLKANKKALGLTEYQPDLEKWNELAEEIKKHGLRFALHMAIAPTATSGVAINSTPSTEPLFDLEFKEEGEGSIITLAPEIAKLGTKYVKAFDCDQTKIIELAAIRQIYLDQAQSINMYFKPPFSLKELSNLHMYAFSLGIKTLYYFNTKKSEVDEVCENCT